MVLHGDSPVLSVPVNIPYQSPSTLTWLIPSCWNGYGNKDGTHSCTDPLEWKCVHVDVLSHIRTCTCTQVLASVLYEGQSAFNRSKLLTAYARNAVLVASLKKASTWMERLARWQGAGADLPVLVCLCHHINPWTSHCWRKEEVRSKESFFLAGQARSCRGKCDRVKEPISLDVQILLQFKNITFMYGLKC